MPTKQQLEDAFENAGIKPVSRQKIEGRDVLLGDGFCRNPHITFKKFGIEEGDFENGCYVAAWLWAQDDDVALGRPLFFDALHDLHIELGSRQRARINAAANDAQDKLKRLKRIEGDGFAV